jgi:hypothetical protein
MLGRGSIVIVLVVVLVLEESVSRLVVFRHFGGAAEIGGKQTLSRTACPT